MAEVCAEDALVEEPADDLDAVVWVEAAPFRAHLAHVLAVGDLTVEVVAVMTGVSASAARHLLSGRGGRRVRRISADTGQRLLRLTSGDARLARRRQVSSRGVARQIRDLQAAGLSLTELARRSGVAEALLADLVGGRREACSQLVVAQVATVHVTLDVGDEVSYPLAS